MTSVVIAKIIQRMFKIEVKIKWPNDILVNGKKVCGILTETNINNDKLNYVVVGIGINVNIKLIFFPDDLRNSITSLNVEIKKKIDCEKMLINLLTEFEKYYKILEEDKFKVILKEWKELMTLFGSYVEVKNFGEKIIGKAIGVNQDDGSLKILLENGNVRNISSGDVTIYECSVR